MLPEGYAIRALDMVDAVAVAAAYDRNREHLSRWDPARPATYFTAAGQRAAITEQLESVSLGLAARWVLVAPDGGVAGRVNLQNIVRGPMQGGTLGYWVDAGQLRRGLARAAVEFAAEQARAMGLHRLEADTVVENVASRSLLSATGFVEIGLAPRFLFINGAWRDHVLHQRLLHDEPLQA